MPAARGGGGGGEVKIKVSSCRDGTTPTRLEDIWGTTTKRRRGITSVSGDQRYGRDRWRVGV
jgi:hypothetical protein